MKYPDYEHIEEHTPLLPGESRGKLGTLGLFALNTFGFSYGLMVATIGLLVLPHESVILFPKSHAMALGMMMGSTGFTQLTSPIAGYFSDRCTNNLGRRRPYIIWGSLIQIFGIISMWYCRNHLWGIMYVAALFVACIGMNIAFAAFSALVRDFATPEQLGRMSGVMAIMTMLGACTGFCLFGFWIDIIWSYHIYVLCTSVCLVITYLVGQEEPMLPHEAEPVVWKEIQHIFWIDRTTHQDFFWVFVLRTLYYMGVSIQTFMWFYLRDVPKVSDPAYYTAVVAMMAQISAAAVAYPSGVLSDVIGRKILVMIACIIMGTVYISFLVVNKIDQVLWLGLLYGVGNGTFLSVDYALAVDTLPTLSRSAQDLGIWGVAAFLGCTFGSVINGVLLDVVGTHGSIGDEIFHDNTTGSTSDQHVKGYLFRGYVSLMVTGTFWLLLAVLCLLKIKGSR